MDLWQIPEEEYLRVETFVEEGSMISPNYDSLLAKLIVWNKNRDLAIESMSKVLNRTAISGVHTNLPLLSGLIDSKEFIGNRIFTNYIDSNLKAINLQIQVKKERVDKQILVFAYLIFRLQQKSGSGNSVWNQIGFWRVFTQFEVIVEDEMFKGVIESNVKSFLISIGNHKHCVLVGQKGKNSLDIQIGGEKKSFYFIENKEETNVVSDVYSFRVRSNLFMNEVKLNNKKETSGELFQNLICADLFGKVLKLNISEGDVIQSGEILLTLESMKTEIHVICPANSRVKKVHVKVGNTVTEKQLLVELEEISFQSQ
jgi:acetyl/propionyl-CoA carboxylase alpha subunit